MGKLFAIIKREYLERVRSKWYIFSTALGPLFFGVIVIVPMVISSRTRPSPDLSHVIILDATGTQLGVRVAGDLAGGISANEPSRAVVRAVKPSELAQAESTATHEVMRGENPFMGYLVLDSATLDGKSERYAGRNGSALVDVKEIEDAVQRSLLSQRLEQEGLQASRIKALTKVNLNMKSERLTERGREAGGLASALFSYMLAFVLYMMLVIYGQQILRGVMEEKTSRVAEVVISSVSTDSLLAGKVIGVGAASLTQMVLWGLSSVLVYKIRGVILASFGVPNVQIPLPHIGILVALLLLVFFIVGFVFYAALFAAMGSTVTNEQDVQQASMPVMLLLIASIVFVQPILLDPTSTLSKVMSWLPFSAPILMPLRMTMIQISGLEIAGTLAGMLIGCALATLLAARIYRVGMLMYGKRPTFREMSRWVRRAT
ncbi:MAG TPA: ABC transporter permease [Gemmatimonadaceae bacterium]|nr:ABC transporter permease [Gemmatimonadaceae bacterium]